MRSICLITLLVIFTSCNKNEDVISCPIIEENHTNQQTLSGDYIQAYPGSVWYFNNGADLECYGPVATKVYISQGIENDCENIIEDQLLTPDHEIFGQFDGIYQLFSDTINKTTERIPFYDTVLGVFYSKDTYHMDEEPGYLKKQERSVLEIKDSIILGDSTFLDIIKVKHAIQITLNNGNVINDNKYYTLAKDIGMVRYEYPKENEDVYCIGYFINK